MLKAYKISLGGVVLLSSCSMMPPYHRPDLPISNRYPNSFENFKVKDTPAYQRASEIGWRDFFSDPYLHQLIEISLQHNRDLRKAVLVVEEARLQYNIQSNEQLPKIDAIADYSVAHSSVDLTQPGSSRLTREHDVGIGLTSFEIDFFGRIESLKEAALNQYLATEEAWRSVQISLISEVANAYLLERRYAEQLEFTRQILAAQEKQLEIVKKRFKIGVSSLDEVHTQESLLEATRSSIANLSRLQAQAINSLTLLTGKSLPSVKHKPFLALQKIMINIPTGLPSDLLLQRPDILQTEQNLRAANANIGAARAAFFPRISLTSFIGSASNELSRLFHHGTHSWSFMPSLNMPIFDWGNTIDNLDLAKVRKEMAIVAYEKAIQSAFQEVSDALVARSSLEQQLTSQDRYVKAIGERTELMKQRYQKGINSLSDLLDIQQEFFNAQLNLIEIHYSRLSNAVMLYKALGGGVSEKIVPLKNNLTS